jgi:hypothetical protein
MLQEKSLTFAMFCFIQKFFPMKRAFLLVFLSFLCCAMYAQSSSRTIAPADTTIPKYEIEVFAGVLKMADWAGFKYHEVMARAEKGEYMAIKEFVNFHSIVDGVDGINHGVSCLELVSKATDYRFSSVCMIVKPKLRKMLLDRMTLAQVRTKKEQFREPMSKWAPLTWAALNNQPLPSGLEQNTLPVNPATSDMQQQIIDDTKKVKQ